ncbi:MAG TPA: hypothetical protein VMX79_01490 [bacterium]|nr:hypothetical protein [bacterium]
MEKLGRVLLVGVVAGLALSIMGTVTHLLVTPLTVDVERVFKDQGFEIVLLGFFFDLATGFFYVLAFAIFRGACPENFWKKFVLFWLLLLLIGVVPRAADVYRYFKFPDLLVLAWLVAWAAEALVVTALVALLFPKTKAGAQGET